MSMRVTFKVDKRISDLADNVNRNLVDKVLPRAMDLAAEETRKLLVTAPEFPDGRKTGTRAKQSKSAKRRYPNHMRDKTAVKKLRKLTTTVARVIGVRGPSGADKGAGQVNFDHGEKGRTVGRVHKLWWVDGVNEKYAKVNPRIQRVDVAKIVIRRAAPVVERIVAEEIRKATLL